MAVDLRCTKRRKRSSDPKTVECWLCGGNHFYREKYTGRVCTREPTYDEERLKRFQGDKHKEKEHKSPIAAAGKQQLSWAAVAAGGLSDSQVRELKQSNEKIVAEMQAQNDSLLKRLEQLETAFQQRAEQTALAVKAAGERAMAAEKMATEANERVAAAEKAVKEEGKRAIAAEKAAKEASERAVAAEKAVKAAEKRAVAAESSAEKAVKAAEVRALVAERAAVVAVEQAKEFREFAQSNEVGFREDMKKAAANFDARELSFCAQFVEWQREWEKKYAVVRKLMVTKQSKDSDVSAASNSNNIRPAQSSVSASVPVITHPSKTATPHKRSGSPTRESVAHEPQDKGKGKQLKTSVASISS